MTLTSSLLPYDQTNLVFQLNSVYFYDMSMDEWTHLSSMQTARFSHGCGLVKKSDGTMEAVVAGGFPITNTVEIFNLETKTWR